MKKVLNVFIICIIMLFLGITIIRADEVKEEEKTEEKTEEIDKTKKYKNGDAYIVIDKSSYNELGEVIQFSVSDFDFSKAGSNEISSFQPHGDFVYFFTNKYDTAVLEPTKWWATLYVCKAIDYDAFGFTYDEEYGIFTDSLLSTFAEENDNSFWTALIGGTNTNCVTMTVEDVPKEDQISFCSTYYQYSTKINHLASLYEKKPKPQYRKEYNENLDLLKANCQRALKNADYNDSCVEVCLKAENDYSNWNDIFYPGRSDETYCGFSYRIAIWVLNIIKWVKYLLPVAVIVLGILDFIKAMSTSKQDEMKHAQTKFIKRLIAAALVFLIPLIVEFVLVKLGFDYHDCGIL